MDAKLLKFYDKLGRFKETKSGSGAFYPSWTRSYTYDRYGRAAADGVWQWLRRSGDVLCLGRRAGDRRFPSRDEQQSGLGEELRLSGRALAGDDGHQWNEISSP